MTETDDRDDVESQFRTGISDSQDVSNLQRKLTHEVKHAPTSPSGYDNEKSNNKLGQMTRFEPSRSCLNQLAHETIKHLATFNNFEIPDTNDNSQTFDYTTQYENLKSQRYRQLYRHTNSDSDNQASECRPPPPPGEEKLFTIQMRGQPLICLEIDGQRRLCLAQISSTLLHQFSYNEIHNRRVALGITCVQCTPSQLELLREAGAMPTSSRRCGTITYREAERLVKSFLDEPEHPKLPENFAFNVMHHCGWGCRGTFVPCRYSSSRAKCIRCDECHTYFSPNKFIFHCHSPSAPDMAANQIYRHPDAANFNAWRRHLYLVDPKPSVELLYAWEDVKAMFNGGNRKRTILSNSSEQIREFQTELESVDCHGDNDDDVDGNEDADNADNGDDDASEHVNPKRSKLITRRKGLWPTYLDYPLTTDKDIRNHDPHDFGQTRRDEDHITNPVKSLKGREFLIENVIRDVVTVKSSSPDTCRPMLPSRVEEDHNQGQQDPVNLSTPSQASRAFFRRRHRNDLGQLKQPIPRGHDSLNLDFMNDYLISYSGIPERTPKELFKSFESNMFDRKINPYESPVALFPNLFNHPPFVNLVSHRNEAPNSSCSTSNNSWPLVFLNQIFNLIGATDPNHLLGQLRSNHSADVRNFCHPILGRHPSLTAFGSKTNLWLSNLQNSNLFENSLSNIDMKYDLVSRVNPNNSFIKSTQSQ